MSGFVLLTIFYTKVLTTTYYADKASCEIALQKSIDFGERKHIEKIECYALKKD